MEKYKVELLINNQEISSEKYAQINNSGRLTDILGTVAQADEKLIDQAVSSAANAYKLWKNTPWQKRAELLIEVSKVFEEDQDMLADLLSRETGMVINMAKAEVSIAARNFKATASLGEEFYDFKKSENQNAGIIVEKVPRGVVAILVPWNVPFMGASNTVSQALLTGNTVVVKPPKYSCMAISIALSRIAKMLPPGVINVVNGGGALLTEHPMVKTVTHTGGTETGKTIMKASSKTLKRLLLELGGNDPAIILDDVDIKNVIPKIAMGAFVNCGQICVATKRIYIPQKMYDEAADLYIKELDSYKVGYQLDPTTIVGPMNNKSQFEAVKELIEDAKKNNAKVFELGKISLTPEEWNNGYYIRPTVVLTNNPYLRVVAQEQFGPVSPLIPYESEEQVLQWANETKYGLGSKIWTGDYKRGIEMAKKIEAGMTTINGGTRTKFEGVTSYFGGIKESGMGWNGGEVGLMHYADYHTITYSKE